MERSDKIFASGVAVDFAVAGANVLADIINKAQEIGGNNDLFEMHPFPKALLLAYGLGSVAGISSYVGYLATNDLKLFAARSISLRIP